MPPKRLFLLAYIAAMAAPVCIVALVASPDGACTRYLGGTCFETQFTPRGVALGLAAAVLLLHGITLAYVGASRRDGEIRAANAAAKGEKSRWPAPASAG